MLRSLYFISKGYRQGWGITIRGEVNKKHGRGAENNQHNGSLEFRETPETRPWAGNCSLKLVLRKVGVLFFFVMKKYGWNTFERSNLLRVYLIHKNEYLLSILSLTSWKKFSPNHTRVDFAYCYFVSFSSARNSARVTFVLTRMFEQQ